MVLLALIVHPLVLRRLVLPKSLCPVPLTRLPIASHAPRHPFPCRLHPHGLTEDVLFDNVVGIGKVLPSRAPSAAFTGSCETFFNEADATSWFGHWISTFGSKLLWRVGAVDVNSLCQQYTHTVYYLFAVWVAYDPSLHRAGILEYWGMRSPPIDHRPQHCAARHDPFHE